MTDEYIDVQREGYFPNLARENYKKSSNETAQYNCIAHAAGRDDFKWWPVDAVGVFWPIETKEETIECFMAAYGTLGYVECTSREHEVGLQKIAIYIGKDGAPSHAARQLDDGRWTSKLGNWEDIEHKTLQDLEDDVQARGLEYGTVAKIMSRPIGQGGDGLRIDPFANMASENRQLLKLLAVPELRTRYLGYVKDIAENWLDWEKLGPIVEKHRDLIAADVETDTHKLHSTAEFTSDTYGNGDGTATDGRTLKGFCEQRRAHLLNLPEIKKLAQRNPSSAERNEHP